MPKMVWNYRDGNYEIHCTTIRNAKKMFFKSDVTSFTFCWAITQQKIKILAYTFTPVFCIQMYTTYASFLDVLKLEAFVFENQDYNFWGQN